MPTLSLTIRPATSLDSSVVLELIQELAEYERLADEVQARERDIAQALSGNPPAVECLLAEVDGSIAGFALFFHNFSTFTGKRGIFLEDLYVRPAWRSRGIGRQLLAQLARIAIDRDCPRFDWVVLSWNTQAIRFYESLGAKQMGDWRTTRLVGDSLRSLADEAKSADEF